MLSTINARDVAVTLRWIDVLATCWWVLIAEATHVIQQDELQVL
jgi:hypothetical protein